MPAKGTKKVKAHIRQKNMFKFGDLKVKDPFDKPKVVQPYYRKKSKSRKK